MNALIRIHTPPGVTPDEPLTLGTARKCVVVEGKSPAPSTLWRWARKGLGPHGIKLQHQRFGKKVVTSVACLERFTQELAESYAEGGYEAPAKARDTIDIDAALDAEGL